MYQLPREDFDLLFQALVSAYPGRQHMFEPETGTTFYNIARKFPCIAVDHAMGRAQRLFPDLPITGGALYRLLVEEYWKLPVEYREDASPIDESPFGASPIDKPPISILGSRTQKQ